jgi:HSP20 family protein
LDAASGDRRSSAAHSEFSSPIDNTLCVPRFLGDGSGSNRRRLLETSDPHAGGIERANQDETSQAVQRWDPIGNFERLRPSLFHRPLAEPWGGSLGGGTAGSTLPAVEVRDSEHAYVVTAELGGCKPDDVTVELHEGVLSIRGEKRSERTEEKEQSRWTERRYGSFHLSFRLPSDVDDDAVEASFKDGVLSISIKKIEETKPKVVRIES